LRRRVIGAVSAVAETGPRPCKPTLRRRRARKSGAPQTGPFHCSVGAALSSWIRGEIAVIDPTAPPRHPRPRLPRRDPCLRGARPLVASLQPRRAPGDRGDARRPGGSHMPRAFPDLSGPPGWRGRVLSI